MAANVFIAFWVSFFFLYLFWHTYLYCLSISMLNTVHVPVPMSISWIYWCFMISLYWSSVWSAHNQKFQLPICICDWLLGKLLYGVQLYRYGMVETHCIWTHYSLLLPMGNIQVMERLMFHRFLFTLTMMRSLSTVHKQLIRDSSPQCHKWVSKITN